MGGYLISLDKNKRPNEVSIFEDRGQCTSMSYIGKKVAIKKYKKLLIDKDPYFYEDEQVIILASGTFTYHRLSIHHGFKELKNDLINGIKPTLFGHFSIIYFNKNKNKITFYFDEAGYGAPYVIDKKFISSSFLACCQYASKLHLNHAAIFEEIYTGCYFNEKTSFHEIRKLKKEEYWKLNEITINFVPLKNELPEVSLTDRVESLNSQAEVLKSYLENWRLQINESKGDLGLSSGYDSRLMLGLLDDINNSKYQVHSYWKKQSDFDNQVGEKLAFLVDKKLIKIPISDRDSLSAEDFNRLIKKGMVYYDGLFPSNHGWTREYRTIDHRKRILGDSRFGLSGISGEQYRNEFNLFKRSYSLDYILENLVLEDRNNEVLGQSSFNSQGIKILRASIQTGLSLKANQNWLTRREIQRYYCEMWVVGGPGIRNQIENQISYFISPFTDRYLQKYSYDIIPFLGIAGRFQADLIKLINPKLATVISDYGFSFDRIPLKHDLHAYVSALVGRKRKMKLKALVRSKKNDFNNFGPHKKIVEGKLTYLERFAFQFPIRSPLFRQDTLDRLIALSTLLQHFESKISNDK